DSAHGTPLAGFLQAGRGVPCLTPAEPITERAQPVIGRRACSRRSARQLPCECDRLRRAISGRSVALTVWERRVLAGAASLNSRLASNCSKPSSTAAHQWNALGG